MTIIAALVHEGKVYMGGDSLSVSEDGSSCVDTFPKVFRVGEYLFGCSGSPRLKQLLCYTYTPADVALVDGGLACTYYMVNNFTRDLRTHFERHDFLDEFKERSAQILIGFKKRLFCLYGDYYLEECSHDYNAIGCAADFALGSLYTTAISSMEPRDRIYFALEAAQKHNAHVRAPFLFEVL